MVSPAEGPTPLEVPPKTAKPPKRPAKKPGFTPRDLRVLAAFAANYGLIMKREEEAGHSGPGLDEVRLGERLHGILPWSVQRRGDGTYALLHQAMGRDGLVVGRATLEEALIPLQAARYGGQF